MVAGNKRNTSDLSSKRSLQTKKYTKFPPFLRPRWVLFFSLRDSLESPSGRIKLNRLLLELMQKIILLVMVFNMCIVTCVAKPCQHLLFRKWKKKICVLTIQCSYYLVSSSIVLILLWLLINIFHIFKKTSLQHVPFQYITSLYVDRYFWGGVTKYFARQHRCETILGWEWHDVTTVHLQSQSHTCPVLSRRCISMLSSCSSCYGSMFMSSSPGVSHVCIRPACLLFPSQSC